MSPSEPVVERVSTSRMELHDIYESAHVEVRQRGADESSWVLASDAVRERGECGVVITAWNPGQWRPTPEVNDAANQRLLRVLMEHGYEIWEADGFSPDRSFREPGFIAWGMDAETGCDIAREFGQFAIFYYLATGERQVMSA